MSFSTPQALVLLVVLPLIVWLVWRPRRTRRGEPRPGRPARPLSGWAGLLLRLSIVGLVVLSLAGAQLVRAVNDLAVIFLVDASDSMSRESLAAAEQFVREATATMSPDDRAGVILFGGNALVEQPLRAFRDAAELLPFASQVQRLNTDIAEAIRLSLALLPPDVARRVVVLSDGAQTTGDAAEAARLAAASGVSIDYVYLPRAAAGNEVILRDVNAPGRVGQGETFRLEVSADSTTATTAVLRVLGDTQIIHEEEVTLQPGVNNLVVRLRASEPAFSRYRVQLSPTPGSDTYPQNNELAAFTEIIGRPRVLVVSAADTDEAGAPLPDESAELRAALEAAGLQVEHTTPQALTPDLAQLADYAGVVLVDVNARDLSPRKMETLQRYVRDLGGGLVVVGGPESYGMGGYFETPLEEVLPVEMQIKDQERFPSVSLVLVLDRSGSMAAEEGGVTKIQLAAEGAVRALELLNDFDELTVIPVDEQPNQVIGPVTSADRDAAVEQIRRLGAGGGGIYVRTGLEAAAEVLAAADSEVKHIVVLADGADSEQKEGVPELISSLTGQGVTVSMVSIGDGPDTPWLREMAELGNGRFHLTNEAANLPQIFTQETAAIQRNYLVEERFFPEQTADSPILTGIDAVPPLYGYVAAEPKDTAQVVLTTHQGDPLLATWQYGLGRSLAWTSDATGRWGRDWARWNGFPTFWGQAVRSTISRRSESGLEASINSDGEQARLTVDALTADGAFRDGLDLTANIVDPAGGTRTVALRQTAPGRYEAAFTPTVEGAYLIGVGATDDAGLRQTAGWVLGYSPEYQNLNSDPSLLASVAAATGGRALDIGNDGGPGAASVFDHNLDAVPSPRPIWPWLTLAAVLLLPLDIASRRLVLTRRDWVRARAAVAGRLRRAPTAAPSPQRSEAMSQLMEAKERARSERRPVEVEAPPAQETVSGEAQVAVNQLPADPSPTSADEVDSLAARLRRRRKV